MLSQWKGLQGPGRDISLLSTLLILSLLLTSVASAASIRSSSGLQALYGFNEGRGNVVHDISGVGKPVNLKISKPDNVQWKNGSLEITQDTQIRSDSPAYKLNESIRRSGEITIEAWIQPENLEQKGPARIVTLSRNGTERNFTLGQEGSKYDVRLRTLTTGGNGIPSTTTKKASVTTELTHVAYTRARSGRARLYINGEKKSEKTVGGSTYNWHGQFKLSLGNEFGGKRAWLGSYHLVAIYSRNLLPKEIQAHFEAGPEAETPKPEVEKELSPNAQLFTTKIAPLLVERCFECHDTSTRKGKLDLSRKTDAFAGSSSGEVLVPGNSKESYLYESILSNEMPEDREPLTDEEKQWVKEWIDDGASWPVEEVDPAAFVHGGTSGENWLQRLTVSEYVQSVQAAVGVSIQEKAQSLLPRDLRADGFSNTAYNLNVDLKHVSAYAQLAELIVNKMDVIAFAAQFSKSQLLTDDSMRGLIEEMGAWILRGPIDDHEITLYRGISTTVAAAGGTFPDAVRLIVDAMLQSPRFIYRMENQKGDGTRWPVGEHELAARISYILWGAPPDKALAKAAKSGELFTPEGLEKEIKRMLADSRAIERSRQFISEWLNLNRLSNLKPNSKKFPKWQPELATDMQNETLEFFEDLTWKQQRPLADLFNAQFTYASSRLATHYDLKETSSDSKRYDLTAHPGRGGILTQGSTLTVGGDEASMVARGLFVLHDLLRGVVNDPPPCVDTNPPATKAGVTQRAIAEERVANAQCGGCHKKFEPLAYGLEKFDGIGAYHEKDEHGNELREDGVILFPGTADSIAYSTSAELMNHLAESDRIKESLTWKLTQFALGRPLGFDDAANVDKIHREAQKNGGTYQSLIAEIVKSDLVRMTPTETNE
jgi:hypothetical protein